MFRMRANDDNLLSWKVSVAEDFSAVYFVKYQMSHFLLVKISIQLTTNNVICYLISSTKKESNLAKKNSITRLQQNEMFVEGYQIILKKMLDLTCVMLTHGDRNDLLIYWN